MIVFPRNREGTLEETRGHTIIDDNARGHAQYRLDFRKGIDDTAWVGEVGLDVDFVRGIIGFGRFAAGQSGAVALCGEGAGDGLTDVGTCAKYKDDGRRDRHDFQCSRPDRC